MGFNTCILAYGITGSGKTHTIFGSDQEDGIALLSVNYVFQQIRKLNGTIELSFFEVYNESIRDLLSEDQQHTLFMYECKEGTQIIGINSIQIESQNQMHQLIFQGNQKRVLAQTLLNQQSSRSHAILQINIKYHDAETEKYISPKLYIVDLAGSEKVYLEQKYKNQIEGSNINKSLLALGNCLNILSDKSKKNQFIPYRNSKLTRILKDSLGGNTRTILISCISQCRLHYDETLNTLTYSKRANQITRKVYREINKEVVVSLPSTCKKLSQTFTENNFQKVNQSQGILKEEYLDKIYQDIFSNIEEFYEITQSLYELQNIVQLKLNICQIEQIYHKNLYNKWASLDQDPQYHLLLNQQIENQAIENRLQEALKINLNQKEILKNLLFKLCAESRDNQDRLNNQINTLLQENQNFHQMNHLKQKESLVKDQIIQQQQSTIENLRLYIKNFQQQPSIIDADNSYPSSFASSKSTSIQPIKRTNQQKLASISKDQKEEVLKTPNNQQAYLADLFSKSKFSSLKILLNSRKKNSNSESYNNDSYFRRGIKLTCVSRQESIKSREQSPIFVQSGFNKKKDQSSMKKVRKQKKPQIAKIELFSLQQSENKQYITAPSSNKQSILLNPSVNITEVLNQSSNFLKFESIRKSE